MAFEELYKKTVDQLRISPERLQMVITQILEKRATLNAQ